jgi:hypothetical protein
VTQLGLHQIPGPDPGACPGCGGWRKAGMLHICKSIPWTEKTAPDRLAPRECVGNARNALDRAYGHERAAVPHLIEAVDWLRRALEQMAEASE